MTREAGFGAEAMARFEQYLNTQITQTTDNRSAGLHRLQGLHEASKYALQQRGKRIRPCLVYAAGAAVNLHRQMNPTLDAAACALEFIHTYSLIHDDLPAMDDDDLRRGNPTVHRAYDEATAILVGDALQASAFELLADAADASAEQRVAMIRQLAAASGPDGMVGGQFIDIQATGSQMELESLRTMHALKTGALIRASVALGGIANGASHQQLAALDAYGQAIGLAFQVVDDILDVEGDAQSLGKTQGKDERANKPTYVQLLGLAGARQEAEQLLSTAVAALKPLGAATGPLCELAHYIVDRKK